MEQLNGKAAQWRFAPDVVEFLFLSTLKCVSVRLRKINTLKKQTYNRHDNNAFKETHPLLLLLPAIMIICFLKYSPPKQNGGGGRITSHDNVCPNEPMAGWSVMSQQQYCQMCVYCQMWCLFLN